MAATLQVNDESRTVEVWLEGAGPGAQWTAPWGVLTLGKETGAGQVVEVEAAESFTLVLHTANASYLEYVAAGRSRLLLTALDRTDVA